MKRTLNRGPAPETTPPRVLDDDVNAEARTKSKETHGDIDHTAASIKTLAGMVLAGGGSRIVGAGNSKPEEPHQSLS